MLGDIRDSECSRCPLSADLQPSNICQMGQGAMHPRFMFVSKSPMSQKQRDDISGFLRQAMIDPAECFFTAATRCRVWESEPTKADLKACATYLEQEIDLVKPGMIIPLGNEALQVLTGKSGIMKYRGQQFEFRGVPVVPTIASAMVKRNPGLTEGFIADLAYVRALADPTEAVQTTRPRILSVTTPDGLRRLTERLRTCEGVYFDIETNGFDEFRPDQVMLSIAFATWDKGDDAPRDCWFLPLAHPESPFLSRWREVLRAVWERAWSKVRKNVAHNGKFDQRWCHQYGAPVGLTFDTMLGAHLLDENRPKALESLSRTLLGVAPWKIDNRRLAETPLKRVAAYNGMDVWNGARLYFVLRRQLLEQPRLAKLMAKLMVPLANAMVDIERRGIWTDREALATNARIAEAELRAIDDELISLVPDNWRELSGAKEMNFNASNFARWLLFDHLGHTIEETAKGQPSMAEAHMLKLRADNPDDRVLELMIERTKWQKYSSAFFAAYQEQIDDDDRIHTTFKVTGTVTGRLSSGKNDDDKVTGRVQNRGVNLQQVPRDGFVRGIFGAPPGSVFVECDYSQVELRIAAFLARERTMMHLYQTGQDIHMTMAMRMTGKPESDVTKEERKKAKAVNFGFLYGMGWLKFIDTAWSNYGVVVTEREAKAFRTAFFEQFSDLPRWHQRQRSMATKYKRVESPLGRVRHLPDIDSPNEGVRHEAERQAINSPVQSFASDLCVLSLIQLTRVFAQRGYRAHSVGTVHDAINFEVPIDEAPIVIPLIRRVMEGLPLERDFGVVLDVPIIADVKIGQRWGGAEEVPGDISSSESGLRSWMNERVYA